MSHVLFVHLLPVSFAEKLLKLLKLGRASALAGLSGGALRVGELTVCTWRTMVGRLWKMNYVSFEIYSFLPFRWHVHSPGKVLFLADDEVGNDRTLSHVCDLNHDLFRRLARLFFQNALRQQLDDLIRMHCSYKRSISKMMHQLGWLKHHCNRVSTERSGFSPSKVAFQVGVNFLHAQFLPVEKGV